MASSSEQTLILTDASVQEQVVAALESLGLTAYELHYEPDNALPGQTFAIDLHGRDDEHLAQLVDRVRAVLTAEVGLNDVPTFAEYESALAAAS